MPVTHRLLALAVTVAAVPAAAQRPASVAAVFGALVDSATGRPIVRGGVCTELRLGSAPTTAYCARTDTAGAFRLDLPAAGTMELVAYCRDVRPGSRQTRTTTVVTGENRMMAWRMDGSRCDQRPLLSRAGEFTGHFVAGFEASNFQWTEDPERSIWVDFLPGAFPSAISRPAWSREVPYPCLHVRWSGTLVGPDSYGHEGVATHRLLVERVFEAVETFTSRCASRYWPMDSIDIADAVARKLAEDAGWERPGIALRPFRLDSAAGAWDREAARVLRRIAPALLPALTDSAAYHAPHARVTEVEIRRDSVFVRLEYEQCGPAALGSLASGTSADFFFTRADRRLKPRPESSITHWDGECEPWARPAPSTCPPVTVRPLTGADAECASREALRDSVLVAGSLADHLIALGRRAPQRGGIRGPYLLDSASVWNRLLLQALRVRAPDLVAPVADSLRRRVARVALNYVERRGDSLAVQFEVGFCNDPGEAATRFHRVLTRRDPVFREDMRGLTVMLHGLACGPGR